jgi:hypothetical protein
MAFHTLKTTHRNLMIFTISCLSLLVIKTFQITSVFIYFIWWYFTNLKKGWCYYCTPGYISKPQGWNMNPKCILRRAKLTSNYNEGQVNRHSGALPLFWRDFLFIIIIYLFIYLFWSTCGGVVGSWEEYSTLITVFKEFVVGLHMFCHKMIPYFFDVIWNMKVQRKLIQTSTIPIANIGNFCWNT